MTLSGAQQKQIQEALVAAFGNEDNLRQMLKYRLDVDLDAVAKPANMAQRTFEVVTWADSQGRASDLIAGALAQNPNNPSLIALAEAAREWRVEQPEAGTPPYQGLTYFDVSDADRFFGREALTQELVAYLKGHRFLAVVGASGSGKSSVVRAGVLPVLQQGAVIRGSDKWQSFIVTPTAKPLETLAVALNKGNPSVLAAATLTDDMRKDARSLGLHLRGLTMGAEATPHVVLVVDQFEELFTLCKEKAERKAFVDNLLAAAARDGVTTVILTLRADFYAHCAEYDSLRTALESDQRYIGAMSRDELRAAIERPATKGNWDLEQGLTDLMLDDIDDEPGALPLLSHALLETWKRRRGRMLTFAGYREAGGVRGAIAHTADAVYGDLPPHEQAVARSIFVRLTELGEGVQDTRRRVPLAELASLADFETVLQKLEDARLVAAEGQEQATTFVDVTHEALIREWPRLREWLDEDREGLRTLQKLTAAAGEWERQGRDAGALYRGRLLEQATAWTAENPDALNTLERAFLDASLAQAARAKRTQLWLRSAAAGVVVILIGAVIAFFLQNQQLEEQTQQLEEQTQHALVAEATAQANADLANAQLEALAGEQLFAKAKQYKADLDVTNAISYFTAAADYPKLGIDVSAQISDTLRYVATAWVQEGERLLRESGDLTAATAPPTTTITVEAGYLAWAEAVLPQIVGWTPELPAAQQQAVITATALFSQALALNPPSDTPVYVWIEGGEFMMGSTDEDSLVLDDEKPAHLVRLDGYWMQRTEVTNEQYKRCVDAGACTMPDSIFWDKPRSAKLPVVFVDWEQASTYAAWVGGRLPTEAEWEMACRSDDGRIYPWGDAPPASALLNYYYEVGGTTDVGSYPPRANGLYDMAGNAFEWTADWYARDYYQQLADANGDGAAVNPTGPATGDDRTLRGGSWFYSGDRVRCAVRDSYWVDPGHRVVRVGFRVVSPGF